MNIVILVVKNQKLRNFAQTGTHSDPTFLVIRVQIVLLYSFFFICAVTFMLFVSLCNNCCWYVMLVLFIIRFIMIIIFDQRIIWSFIVHRCAHFVYCTWHFVLCISFVFEFCSSSIYWSLYLTANCTRNEINTRKTQKNRL